MSLYFLSGRRLCNDGADPESVGDWSGFVDDLADGCSVYDIRSYSQLTSTVSHTRRSAISDCSAVMSFADDATARRAEAVMTDRLRLNAADRASAWSASGRLFRVVDSISPTNAAPHCPSRARDIPAAAGLYAVGWRPQASVESAFAEWYDEHLRWNAETYRAVDAVRCVKADGPEATVTYPFDWLVLYWFDTATQLAAMCDDLTERYRRGWPDASRWADSALVDRAPFESL